MTSAPVKNTDRPAPEYPDWQLRPHELPRVILSTGRLDINKKFQKGPVGYLDRFMDRAERLFPRVMAAHGAGGVGLMVKSPAEGRGMDWHDQFTGLPSLHWDALRAFRQSCLMRFGSNPYLYTRPGNPFPEPMSSWPTLEFVRASFPLWLDSTASTLHLALQVQQCDEYAGNAPVGIEGWGDLWLDRPGPALMNWAKVERGDHDCFGRDRLWEVRRRLSGTPWLYTLTIDPRGGEEIPSAELSIGHSLGRSVVCINPSDALAQEIDDLYSRPLVPAAASAPQGGAS